MSILPILSQKHSLSDWNLAHHTIVWDAKYSRLSYAPCHRELLPLSPVWDVQEPLIQYPGTYNNSSIEITETTLGTRRTDGRGVSVTFATRTDVCSSALLARNICLSSFRPIFSMFQETLQCSEELSWWHGSLVLSPSPLQHEFRNYWRKNSVQQRVQRTRNVNMPHPTPAPAPHPGSCGTSTTCATYKER